MTDAQRIAELHAAMTQAAKESRPDTLIVRLEAMLAIEAIRRAIRKRKRSARMARKHRRGWV